MAVLVSLQEIRGPRSRPLVISMDMPLSCLQCGWKTLWDIGEGGGCLWRYFQDTTYSLTIYRSPDDVVVHTES